MSEFLDQYLANRSPPSLDELKKQDLSASMTQALGKSPDQAASVYNLSTKTALSPDYVERNPDKAKAATIDYDKIQAESPVLSEYLSTRKNADISHDDLDNLSWWETSAKEGKNLASLVPSTLKSVSSSGYAILGSMFDLSSSLVPEIKKTDDGFNITQRESLKNIGGFLKDIAKRERAGAEYYFPDDSLIPTSVLGGVKSFIMNMPLVGASVLTRNPGIALGGMGAVTYGDSYLKADDAGLSPGMATIFAANDAFTEVLTEKIPAIRLIEDYAGGTGFMKMLTRQLGAEIPGEQLATLLQDFNEWTALNPEKTLSEFAAERPGAAVDTLISTIVSTGLQTSVISGFDKAFNQREQETITSITEKAQESKVLDRSPELFMQHLDELSDEYGAIDNVYIDGEEANVLFQDLQEDDAFNLIAEQLEEAINTKGDIVIPMSEFVGKVVKSKNFEALKPHIRLSPDSPTQAELANPEMRTDTILQEAQARVQMKDEADGIYKQVVGQLIDTGRLTPEQSKVSAEIIPAYVTTMASRMGLGVGEVYDMMGLSIVGPETQIKGDALTQTADQEGKKEARGQISILPDSAIIKLTESSNLSTFLHESSHLFLEMEGRLHAHPSATGQIKEDGDKILKYLGAESFESVTTEQHEKWARGMETYFGEGKAPSVDLQSAFRRFSAWLKQIYRSLTKLNAPINDEVRAVMARMLATDDQIDRASGYFEPLFDTAEDAGMTKAEFKAYSAKASNDSAKEDLQAKLVKQLKRQATKWWREEKSITQKRIREELLSNPLYSATEYIKGDTPIEGHHTTKLNRGAVKDELGYIPPNLRGMTEEAGTNPDKMAAYFGFGSGSEMIHVINESPTLSQEVNRLAQEEMLERHGDMLNDGSIEEQAQDAMRNTDRAKKLLSELKALSRKNKQPLIDREALKEYTKKTIGAMAYTQLRPARYRAAEIRAAREAAVAKSKGDMVGAQKAKTQEIINFYLGKEATKALDKAEKIRTSLKAIQGRKYDSAKIDTDYVNQAKVLIKAYDFRKTSPDAEELGAVRLESVRNWIESQQLNPDNVATFVQAEILGKLIPYKEMTVDDLVGLNDVVKSIMHAAKERAEENKAAYRANIETGVTSITDNRIETYETEMDTTIPWVKTKNMFDEATASLRKLESLARQADGMKDQGWVWRNTVKPLLDASTEALKRRAQSGQELKDLFHGFNGAFSGLKDIRTFKLDSGKSFRMSYGARLSLALNLGNNGNLDALKTMKALPLTDKDINQIVGTLSERDWALVQGVWDYIDSYFPEIANLEKKRSGAAPQKVKARSFTTPSGIAMKGGYYPLSGDPSADTKQLEQDIDTQAAAMMNGGTASKSTKHGSTIERVGFGGKKIDFSVNVLFNHIDGIIHDVTHWQAVKDVDRVLKNEKINSELATSLSRPGVQAMKQRLKETAAGPQRLEGLGWVNRTLRHARLAATYGALGYSIRTALINTMGLTTAIADMDAKSIASGTMEYWRSPRETSDFILSKSEYMKERGQVLNRDVAYIRANLKGDNFFTKFKDQAFWLMTQTDKVITRPIWLAAYREGERKFDTEQQAIDHADRMVARTQGSGMDMDLANVETRNELMKTMTVMYTAFSAIYNIMLEQVKRRKVGQINSFQLAAKLTWLTIVPGILTALLTQSDDEELGEEALWEIAGQWLGMIPILRDVFSTMRYGSTFPSPIVQLGIAPFELTKQVAQGDIDKAAIRALTTTLSMAHVPGGAQFNRTFGYLTDLQDGEISEFSPYDLLVTGKE